MELISSIIGRSQVAVSSILGAPDTIQVLPAHKYPLSVKSIYLQGVIEIIFIDHVADWIIIRNKNNEKNIETILDFIDFMGLLDMEPALTLRRYSHVASSLTYKEIEGLKEITIFLTFQKEIDYVSIKVFSL